MPELLKAPEACNYLNVSLATLYRLINRRAIKRTKLPTGGVRFQRKTLDDFIDRNTKDKR